jgi:hypothetical protein
MPRPSAALLRAVAAGLAAAAWIAPAVGIDAQARRPSRKPAPPPPATVAPADVSCPNILGRGVRTKLVYCDVITGRNPAEGIRIKLPPHTGGVRLTFMLHNRHLYSEEQMRSENSFARYSATIGALAPDGTLIRRAIVQSEFRTVRDLVDRIESGPSAPIKAIAPTGAEPIAIDVPAELDEVSLLGEKLEVERAEGKEVYASPGRLIATVSDLKVEYRPKPPPRTTTKNKPTNPK